jgi:hypothetical protein
MADISGTVTSVTNTNNPATGSDFGCAIIDETATGDEEVVSFWPGPMGSQNNRRLYFNTMFCTALSTGKTVNVTTDGPTSAVVISVTINS